MNSMIKAKITCLDDPNIKWPTTYQICPRIGETIFSKGDKVSVGKVCNVGHGLSSYIALNVILIKPKQYERSEGKAPEDKYEKIV